MQCAEKTCKLVLKLFIIKSPKIFDYTEDLKNICKDSLKCRMKLQIPKSKTMKKAEESVKMDERNFYI